MTNLIHLFSRCSPQAERKDAEVLEATQKLNALVCQLTDIAQYVIASSAPEPLKFKIVQNLVGMQRHAHCISQYIISEYRPVNGHRVRQANVHRSISSEMPVESPE
jgi:hypothetical protein